MACMDVESHEAYDTGCIEVQQVIMNSSVHLIKEVQPSHTTPFYVWYS